MNVATVGSEIAKYVSSVHGVDVHGKEALKKTLRRGKRLEFFANLPPAAKPAAMPLTACEPCAVLRDGRDSNRPALAQCWASPACLVGLHRVAKTHSIYVFDGHDRSVHEALRIACALPAEAHLAHDSHKHFRDALSSDTFGGS